MNNYKHGEESNYLKFVGKIHIPYVLLFSHKTDANYMFLQCRISMLVYFAWQNIMTIFLSRIPEPRYRVEGGWYAAGVV